MIFSFVRECSPFESRRRSVRAFLDRPLIWLLPFYLAGIWWGWTRPAADPVPLLALGAVLALAAAVSGKFCNYSVLMLIPAVAFLGWGLTARSLTLPEADHHLLNFTDEAGCDRIIILGGVVLEESGWRPGRNHRLIVEAREVILPGDDGPELVRAVTGKARIVVGGRERVRVEAGDYVRMPVALERVRGMKNPGKADFDKYWGAQGVWVGGFVKSPLLVTSWPDETSRPRLSRWRTEAVRFIENHTSEPVTGLLAAQLAGRRSAVDPAAEEVYRALGLSHVLSISGLHLGVWYGICFWLIRLALRRVKVVGARTGLAAGALALIPALLYAALAGADSPVIRSAVMIAAVVLAALALKRSDPWNILAAAAWGLLLAEPHRLFTASFQLSFAATAAMLAVFVPRPGGRRPAPPPSGFWHRRVDGELMGDLWRRLTLGQPIPAQSRRAYQRPETFFRNAVMAALAGTLGTAPLVILHFGRLPLAGVAANIVFTALLSALVLIPGLLAMALLPLSPELARWPLALADGVQAGLLPVMEHLAAASGPGWLLPAPGVWCLAAWFAAGWVWLRGPGGWKPRLALASAILAAGFLPGLISGPGDRDVLRFTVLDVGQGTAIHLNLPDRGQMLVDGGGTYNSDPGEMVVMPYLLRQGVRRLDVAVLTHPDLDHLKGLVTVVKYFQPREIWDAPWPDDYSPLYQSFLENSRTAARVGLDQLYAGRSFGPVQVRLLWPPPDTVWPAGNPGDSWVNNHGLVLKVEWGGISFLITGDIRGGVEKELARRYGRDLKTTVLMASHHGSREALTSDFLALTNPEWVVFSVGRYNSYNQPHPETVRRAEAVGAQIRRTDLEGAAIFEVREKRGQTVLTVKPPDE